MKQIVAGLGLLAGSYLAAAVTNASPVTQPALTGAYSHGRVVVVAPPPALPDVLPSETFEAPEAPIVPAAAPIQTL